MVRDYVKALRGRRRARACLRHRRSSTRECSATGLRMPPVEEWETWPFDGELRPRALRAAGRCGSSAQARGRGGLLAVSGSRGAQRSGATSAGCSRRRRSRTGCRASCCCFRGGTSTSASLTDEEAADLGRMLVRVERAVSSLPGVGRVHVCRWGDGSYHLHYWFMARPARFPQLIGNFAAVWDDVLPPTPQRRLGREPAPRRCRPRAARGCASARARARTRRRRCLSRARPSSLRRRSRDTRLRTSRRRSWLEPPGSTMSTPAAIAATAACGVGLYAFTAGE